MHIPRNLDNVADSDNRSTKCVRLSPETCIDLEGRASPQQLALEGERLLVLVDGEEDRRRGWGLSRIGGFRLEPLVGSSFLQARVDGRWVDVLRYPGEAGTSLTDLVDRLNAILRLGRHGEAIGRPDEEPVGRGPVSSTRPVPSPRPSLSRRWSTARRLSAMLRPFPGSVLLLLALSAGAVAIEVAPPLLQKYLVDDVLRADPAKQGASQLLLLLLAIVAGLLLVRLAATVVSIWKGWISSRVGTTLTANLREDLVKKLNELPLAFHDRSQVGVLMSRVAYDTETLHTLVYHMTSGFLLQMLQMAGIGIALFSLNPKLAAVTLLPMPLIVAGSWYFTRYLNPRNNHYWEAVGKQASSLTGMLSGIRVVKAFVQEDREIARFSQSSRRLRDSRQTVDASTSMFAALTGFLFALGGLAVWYIGGRDVLFGVMTLGSLMAFLQYLAMFYTPLTSIGESIGWFSNFLTTSRRIFDLLDTPSEIEEDQPAEDPPDRLEGRVEFQNVTFGYQKNRPVLRDIRFRIEPGEMIGVVGRSGSGKSTLVSLIGRLYQADAGRILVDGKDVRELPARQLRRQIGMVPQEPFLFHGSVADNIRYGNPGAAPEDILLAARQADTHGFIMRMPLAYDSQLGEGGSGLSGGEKQRLSIARALVFDPAILILDEATASVDAESERAICEAIRRFSRQRTTIVIAHRLSTLRDADRLLVFDQGRLIEQGTHQELLARPGLYSALARLQGNLRDTRQRMESALGSTSSGVETALAELAGETAYCEAFSADGHPLGGRGDLENDDLGWLDPDHHRFEADDQGALCLVRGARRLAGVYAMRAFPASHERSFLSLRARDRLGREDEVGMLRRLDDWPPAAQRAVERSLSRRYLFHPIREIRQVRTSGQQLILAAWTAQGPARVQLAKPGQGFQPFGRHGLLLIDARGTYYVIPDRSALPRRQQRLLALYFGD